MEGLIKFGMSVYHMYPSTSCAKQCRREEGKPVKITGS